MISVRFAPHHDDHDEVDKDDDEDEEDDAEDENEFFPMPKGSPGFLRSRLHL